MVLGDFQFLSMQTSKQDLIVFPNAFTQCLKYHNLYIYIYIYVLSYDHQVNIKLRAYIFLILNN